MHSHKERHINILKYACIQNIHFLRKFGFVGVLMGLHKSTKSSQHDKPHKLFKWRQYENYW